MKNPNNQYERDLIELRNSIRLAKANREPYGHLQKKLAKLTKDKLKQEKET